ncbi:MAG TPA: lysophospholipid acyltransferase family protein [Bacteroidia bacterium]|nr:lysophospholipid acyltransferase family protein [Bacteroidia bacterium]
MIPRTLWKLFFALNFVTGLVLLYPFFALLLSGKRYQLAFQLMRFWAHWVLHVPGIFLKVKYEIPPDSLPEPCVYVANHSSYLDIVASYVVIPKLFVYLGKSEIEKAPLVRIFFREMNIYVDRKSRSGSYAAIQQASEKLRGGESVFIYPEGTIEPWGRLKLFKNGAFRLAIENQVPVVPITFRNNWKLLQNGGFFKAHGRPGIARVTVHRPILTAGKTEEDLVNLRHQARETIAQELQKP